VTAVRAPTNRVSARALLSRAIHSRRSRVSLRLQSRHWIDVHGASRRNIRGEKPDREEQQGHACKNGRVCGFDAEEQGG